MANPRDDAAVQQAIHQMEVAANNVALRLASSAGVRTAYLAELREMSASIMAAYKKGDLSAEAAAKLANATRNNILDMARANDMDFGRAYAQSLKKTGMELDKVVLYIMNEKKGFKERFAGKLFKDLTSAQQTEIYEEAIRSAGRGRQSVTQSIPRMRWAARGLWVATALIAIYNVGTSQNPWWQTGREASNIGGGLLGSIGGGAAMGAAGGVWAGPIGVGVGVIVGGILGALLADRAYVETAGTGDPRTRGFVARFTSFWTGTDEEGMAQALVSEYRNNLDFVVMVLNALEQDYSSNSDDVAYEYVKRIKPNPALAKSVKAHAGLKKCLADLLTGGWVSSEEAAAAAWLKTP